MVLEVMGRHAGWIALHSGIAGGAHAILIPEHPEPRPDLRLGHQCEEPRPSADGRRRRRLHAAGYEGGVLGEGSTVSIVPAWADRRMLAPLIESRTGIETRATVLGHIQRGGVPSAWDRVLATRMGGAVADLVADNGWGHLVALHGTQMARITFDEALGKLKQVRPEYYDEMRVIFG